MTLVAKSGPSLAFFGFLWPSLAFFGLLWPSLAFFGLKKDVFKNKTIVFTKI
jgi:hypothetical protein